METKNNYAPKTKLYAPFELLKRILPSRESVAPEELEEYDRCSHEWGETVQEVE